MTDGIIFTRSDLHGFHRWVDIDVDAATWRGRNLASFERFWFVFFVDGLSLSQLSHRFEYAASCARVGTVASWLSWVFRKLLCYVFVHKDVSVLRLAEEASLPVPRVASVLRDFLIDADPGLREFASDRFRVGSLADEGAGLRFADIRDRVPEGVVERGRTDGDPMASMEVTLYDEWEGFVARLEGNFLSPRTDVAKVVSNLPLRSHLAFARDVALLLAASFAAILLVREGNRLYERHLRDKIRIYESRFEGSDESLYSEGGERGVASVVRDLDQAGGEGEGGPGAFGEERFETESEFVMTSPGDLPAGPDADGVESGYGPAGGPGYRDSSYGTTKVYRVIMPSVDSFESKRRLDAVMEAYGATRARGGGQRTVRPGGLLYDLFVPRAHTKEFLARVSGVDEASIYESRTRSARGEPGKDKVFIWVHSID